MNIDEILDVIDELLDRSWSLPLSGGRCVVDADKVRDLIDDIRLNIPAEIKPGQGDRLRPHRHHRKRQERGGADRTQGGGPRPHPHRAGGGQQGGAGQGVGNPLPGAAQIPRDPSGGAGVFRQLPAQDRGGPRQIPHRDQGDPAGVPQRHQPVISDAKEARTQRVRASFFAVIPRSPSEFSGRSRAGTWCVPPPARGASLLQKARGDVSIGSPTSMMCRSGS